MEILLLHWENISINIQITDNFTMLQACVGHESCNVHDEGNMLDTIYETHQSALVRLLLQQDFLRIQYSAYPFYVEPVEELHLGEKYLISTSCDRCYTRLWTPLNFCAMCCGLTWSDNKVSKLTVVKVLHTSLLNITVVTFKLCTDASTLSTLQKNFGTGVVELPSELPSYYS
jgi:hypothetical protein